MTATTKIVIIPWMRRRAMYRDSDAAYDHLPAPNRVTLDTRTSLFEHFRRCTQQRENWEKGPGFAAPVRSYLELLVLAQLFLRGLASFLCRWFLDHGGGLPRTPSQEDA